MAKFLKRYRYPYLFIMPFFILFLVFQLVPNLWTVYISLTEWNGIGEPRFTGAQNYSMLFKDYMFWDALKNTVIYWITGVILILALGLLISGLLNYNRLRGKAFFKSATYLPNICAVIAIFIIRSRIRHRIAAAAAGMGIGNLGGQICLQCFQLFYRYCILISCPVSYIDYPTKPIVAH